eukprot:364114-Alexandrium_andersonii.AAC.1
MPAPPKPPPRDQPSRENPLDMLRDDRHRGRRGANPGSAWLQGHEKGGVSQGGRGRGTPAGRDPRGGKGP